MAQKDTFDTNTRDAIVAMAKALTTVFKKFSRQTRTKAWHKLTGETGLKEMEKLLQDPNRPVNNLQKIPLRENFKEWLEEDNQQ